MIDVQPLTPERWPDLQALFGERGAVAGCWCMWWRQTAAEFDRDHGERNRAAFRRIVDAWRVPGLLAYRGEPVGWVSLAPRGEFGRIERSPVLGPIDDRPVWSVVCFYIHRRHRGSGVGTALLEAAVAHAAERGAAALEGYPVDASDGKVAGLDVFTGVPSMFEKAGFREVARRRPKRPIYRRELEG